MRFTVDYLWRDVRQVDLLDTPVMVDPGQEVRGRVPQLLQAFAEQRIAPAEIGAEISVMTVEDQQAVREAGRAIRAGDEVDARLWPGYADRNQLREQLETYARDAVEAGREADYLAETELAPFDAALVGIPHRTRAGPDRRRGLRRDQGRHPRTGRYPCSPGWETRARRRRT
ncbi:Uncharacterised protein [Nocardia farcinica]|uniref:Uncharacterized protein n=1 Tax=Nocardia farcinica TaxID=37329 RepID=A0A449GGI0_NOCFR|nr:Uncharacterised protein [Nocardia farcinica]